jgi:hypothetical protein
LVSIDEPSPESLSLPSKPIIAKVDTNHTIIVVALSWPMFLTVVPERHSDVSERQSSVSAMAERLKSWNAAEAVSMASEYWTRGQRLTWTMLCNKERMGAKR